jgi:hypothetical protein
VRSGAGLLRAFKPPKLIGWTQGKEGSRNLIYGMRQSSSGAFQSWKRNYDSEKRWGQPQGT